MSSRSLITALFLSVLFGHVSPPPVLPITGSSISTISSNEQATEIVALNAPGAFAHPVVPQPRGNHLYVSDDPEALTQFQLATKRGSVGILAHNYLAGEHFFRLKEGNLIYLIYGDGSTDVYRITEIEDFQALSLYLYRDLGSDRNYSDVSLFEKIYSGDGEKLVLQTCIKQGASLAWGRRFVIAQRIATSVAESALRGPIHISYRYH
jgi:hypothetical protein